MENVPQVPSAQDLESRAARIADPAIGLKAKHDAACELREMVDSVRDAESSRVFPHMIAVLLDILRNGEPSFKKDSLEYQFRRVLIEIIHRIPSNEAMRPNTSSLMNTMLHILKNDSEENGVTCVKIIIDIVRTLKTLSEEHVVKFLSIFQELLGNVRDLVNEYLSEDSAPLDTNITLPSARSFKVMSECPIAIVLFFQACRQVVQASLQGILPAVTDVIVLESPAQKNARESKESMGEFWAGTAPTIRNSQIYSDCIGAQIKMISFVAYLMKSQPDAFQSDNRGDEVAVACIRLLQDCPAHLSSGRRELMVVLRHLMGTPNRLALVPHIEKLFSENVLLGPAVGSQETLRPVAYSAIADLVHHLRGELTASQLARIVHVYSNLVHNPQLSISVQTLCAKMMFNMTDAILAKDVPERAAAILNAMLWSCTNKLTSMVSIQKGLLARVEQKKESELIFDAAFIEKSRPIGCASYATDNPEDSLREFRFLFRAILHGIRMCLIGLRKIDAAVQDNELMFAIFETSVRCVGSFEQKEAREEKECMDWLHGVFHEINPHTFQEIWTFKLDFFFEQVVKRPSMLYIVQMLFAHEATSPSLTAIVLRHLCDKLDELGEQSDQRAVTTIRFFKMAFSAVTLFPDANEATLASHLGRLIMDSFALAAKATHPTHYLHLLRALFRAIGSGAGRFELLYQGVLPLLPDMLESLNRQLMAADSQTRDLLVELCLTVPLRLTHLLPHLHYLMSPLVMALQGGHELVSQGLRTLELCIDNLTGDFLDPILRPILRDLMDALHGHLKPLPNNHHLAHTTIRILGKLGGRNRRLLDESPYMQFHEFSDPATVSVSFNGRASRIHIGPMARQASRILQKSNPNQVHAYNFLEHSSTLLLHEGYEGHDREEAFSNCLEGLFDAIHVTEVRERAEDHIKTLSRHVFLLELRKTTQKDAAGSRRFPSKLCGLYLDALQHALARNDKDQAEKAQITVTALIHDLIPLGHSIGLTPKDLMPVLHMLATRFSSLCFDEAWVRRNAGCTGLMILSAIPEIGEEWTKDRDVDIVRTLLHVLKDLPHDPPRNVSDIVDILTRVIKVSCGSKVPLNNSGNLLPPDSKVPYLIGIFFADLSSSHPVVRQVAQSSISLLSDLSGIPIPQLLAPQRDRVLTVIYVKPLRALPFSIQIGQIEAIRYCVSLDPPLPEMNEQLLRLLHEALALAEAEDSTLSRNRTRKMLAEITQLRVSCIRLLTASMPLADYFSKQHSTRQKLTGVYFKSLYSSSKEVKDVAHEGLRAVLGHQNRLPKDLLQTGLRPILMNLADPKKLSVAGLEGLARLLELLTHYFKVEIGHKLLDHFRIIADPQMLRSSSRLPLSDNDGITKLNRLVNIFHLLPSTANIFLENLVNAVVTAEAHLHSATRSPFSEPLGKFLNRYPSESVDYLLQNLHIPRLVRTFRNVLTFDLSPMLHKELVARVWDIVMTSFSEPHATSALPGLILLNDLAKMTPGFCKLNSRVIEVLIDVWRCEPILISEASHMSLECARRHDLMIGIFKQAMLEEPRIDILFDIVAVYTRHIAMDLTSLTEFLYQHVALNSSTSFRRNILLRFLTWFDNHSQAWSSKTYFLRHIVTPMILVHSNRSEHDMLLDKNIIKIFHNRIWRHLNDTSAFGEADDMLRIELLHLTTVMVHRYPSLLLDAKKDIIKCAWTYIVSDDTVVKQTAYLLAARFFEAYDTPPKFILTAWTGLLRPPHSEGRTLVRQALDILAPVLQQRMPAEQTPPLWAKTTRRLLAEEGHGLSQIIIIYQLINRQPDLFYSCRALFIPHMVNSLSKLGLHGSATHETRLLSLDILSVMFHWEQNTSRNEAEQSSWMTPLGFRETMLSYLVRLATGAHDAQTRNTVVPRALSLLREVLGATGWNDVSIKLDFFRKALDQNEINESTLPQANAAARVLNVVCADKPDLWFIQNAAILIKLVQKGILVDDVALQDSLHPVLERLLRLFPLPKEDEVQTGELAEFHTFVASAIGDGLRNMTSLRGTLLVLKSVVQIAPERIEPFSAALMRLSTKLTKEHITSEPDKNPNYDSIVRLLISILEISQITVMFLADQRKWLIATVIALVEKSSSPILCRFLLSVARDWALHKRDAYPTTKEKANILQKMALLESRGDILFNEYLELIYDIYVEPSLRRSDLTSRLEQAFLLGCRSRENGVRERFVDLLDGSIPKSLTSRLSYVFGGQSWEALADHNWIFLALDLLLSSVDDDEPLTSTRSLLQMSPKMAHNSTPSYIRDLINPLRRLLYTDAQTTHDTWVSVFSSIWSCLSRKEQENVTNQMVVLLSRDYHVKQSEMRPNVILTLLDGLHLCSPPLSLPPHLLKYLAKTFGAWYVILELLQDSLEYVREDENIIKDCIFDALAEVYAEVAEEDMFYGLWRRRSLQLETNTALSFEQNGMWSEAQIIYENAQNKAKSGIIPIVQSEYCLWEDHWMLAAEKLQHWDILFDLARIDNTNQELMLESAWRTKDWADQDTRQFLEDQIQLLPDAATPRRRVFEAFLALVKVPGAVEKNAEFTRILEDAMQLSLRKWVALPRHMSIAHIPLLQHFQQFVELQEAVQIFGSLATTTPQNLEKKSSDLKLVLQAWRERLPNLHDDISVWSDLVAWRQNVFHAINKHYIPLIQPSAQNGATANNVTTFGYRGYHETAWIINRFAHVARKHELLDVSQTFLKRIYELPNIEISEAFLKLREEARCHLQVDDEWRAGLDLINNTNLMYFSNPQKAEFYTLKGMFESKLEHFEDANQCFAHAVQLDLGLAKAWAEWGRYNDMLFKQHPADLSYAGSAVSCYLQAAGVYKNGKSRPLLSRVLWLLSLDDKTFTISRAFDTYKGDIAIWYWITLIPQLCLSLSHREVKQARQILMNLAKVHPQALFFPLRTTKDELASLKQQENARAARAKQASLAASATVSKPLSAVNGEVSEADGTNTNSSPHSNVTSSSSVVKTEADNNLQQGAVNGSPNHPLKPASDYAEELMTILKTAYPLLALSLETLVDQMLQKFRATSEEEIYRFTCMLLQDAMTAYSQRIAFPDDDGKLSPTTVEMVIRVSANVVGPAKSDFEKDFVHEKPPLNVYIRKLQEWRNRYERFLDSRPRIQPLDLISHYLTEFHHTKIDEIEVPGQYLEHVDSNSLFSRINQFDPRVEMSRGQGYSFKRILIHGHDGTKHRFAVHFPAARFCRREDRVMQFLRTLNSALTRRKETRKRNLHFHFPTSVSLSPQLRILSNDSSYVTLQDIYDRHCSNRGFVREDPILIAGEQVKQVLREAIGTTKTEYVNLKKQVMDEVNTKYVPDDVIDKYIRRTMESPSDLWRIRKQFAAQWASNSFLTYVFCMTSRMPARFHWSRTTGEIYMSEMLPAFSANQPVPSPSENVPFRFTPNIQRFIGPIATEGVFLTGIVAIAKSVTSPQFDLEGQLALFCRDEVFTWYFTKHSPYPNIDKNFRDQVAHNVDAIVKKAELMSCKHERSQDVKEADKPVQLMQTVTSMISMATNSMKLASMIDTYNPWF